MSVTAMADLAYEYQDKKLQQACRNLWDNMVHKRMYITGSVGSSGFLERFTTDYDLPMTAIILRHVLRLHLLCLKNGRYGEGCFLYGCSGTGFI